VDSLGNVYVVGASQTSGNPEVPGYWKNGTGSVLPMGTGNTSGMAVAVVMDS
jgi:hypothetical protein